MNAHYDRGATYPAVDLFDPDLAIAWPIPREQMVLSDKDRANPPLAEYPR